MKQDPWKYHLILKKREPGKIIGEDHSFSTLQQATHKLLSYAIEEADHDHLAKSRHHRHIAKIYGEQLSEVVLTLTVVPTAIEGIPVSKSGLYISNPNGTILDFEQLLGLEESNFFRIKGYNSNKSNLWLAHFQQDHNIPFTIDSAVFGVYADLTTAVADSGQFRFTIANQDPHAGQRIHGSTNYYYDTGMAALQGLLHDGHFEHSLGTFIDEMDREPFHFGVYGPGNKLLAETRLIAANDPAAHLWPKPGLYLRFTDGPVSFMREHCPAVELPKQVSAEDNALLMATISRKGEILIASQEFHDLKYSINRAMSEASAPPYPGYYIELVYAPSYIQPAQVREKHLERSYRPIDSFVQGLQKLRETPLSSFDRDHALTYEHDNYLLRAMLMDDGKEVARIFSSPQAPGALPPGIYLNLSPDQLTTKRLSQLGPVLSELHNAKGLHFLIARLPKDHPVPGRKHGDTPRPLWPGSDGQRGL